MDSKDREIERLEGLATKNSISGICGTLFMGIIGIILAYGSVNIKDNLKKYNQIFLEEINKESLITKQDSIYFYQKHGLEKYIVNGNPLDIPYSKIKKIVKEKLK